MDIDLNVKPSGDDGEGDKSKGRKGEKKPPRQSRAESARLDRELQTRLEETLGRVAEERHAHDDEELGDIIREDAQIMAQGIVRLARPIPPLRALVAFFVAFIEPVLAFRRVLRVVISRWVAWRIERTPPQDEVPPPHE